MQVDSKTSGHVPELDGVRGIACIFIILLHCLIGISTPIPGSLVDSLKSYSISFLIGGVDLFFVLSGLLIGGILLDNRDSKHFFKAFWVRRIARIFPVNYALIGSYVIALSIQHVWHFPQLTYFALREPIHSPLWYATYTQSIPFALTDWGPGWMGITWSLAIEEQFYILFPFAVYFFARRYIVFLTIGAIVISPLLFALVELWSGRSDTAYVLLPCRMSALFLGVLVACIVRDDRALATARRFRLLLDCLIVFLIYATSQKWVVVQHFALLQEGHLFAAALFHSPLEYLQLSIMFALLLLRIFLYDGGLFRAVLRSRFLAGVGLISFALYMYHQAVNATVHGFVFGRAPSITNIPELAAGLLVVTISTALAVLSYFYLEMPIRRWGRRVQF